MVRIKTSICLRGMLLGYLVMALTGVACSQTFLLEGRALEAVTNEPVAAAQVRVQGRAQGTLTDAEGRFSLVVDGKAQALEITHIGYQRRVVQVEAARAQVIEVELVAAEMAPVIITAGPQRIFEDKTVHLYDYELLDEHIMAIVYDRKLRRSKLALLNARDSILDWELLPEEPGKLVKDCLGNVHAITQHFACQLYWDGEGIGYYVDSLSTFERVVMPCIGNIGGHYYFQHFTFNDQVVDFLSYDIETEQWTTFLHLMDKVRMHQLMDPLDRYSQLASSESAMASLPSAVWEQVGKLDAEAQFQKLAFFRPVDALLRVIHEELYVFDHLQGRILHCARDGRALGEVPISFHKARDRQRVVLVDAVRGEAYTAFEKYGYTRLCRIDLHTGALGTPTDIPVQFPHKLQVRDGVVYFLYQEGPHDPVKRLYRMVL